MVVGASVPGWKIAGLQRELNYGNFIKMRNEPEAFVMSNGVSKDKGAANPGDPKCDI
jgi:hypothetical protein